MVYPLITLYSPTETEFLTNGLGSLGDATSCIVTEEANGSFELEMVYPITGRRYKDIESRCIIFAKPNPVDPPQAFRIYEISKPMDGLVTYYAAHISYDLSGYPVKSFTADSCISAFTGLKANSVINHPFNFWTDKEVASPFTLTIPVSSRTVLGGVQGSILDTYGGEYKFDNFMVRLYVNRGMDRGVTIRYGKNLTDLNQEENCSNVYTGVMPYWESFEGDLVQLPELYIPAEGSYNFTKILTLDLSTSFQEAPTEAELRERAQKYMKDNKIGTPKVSLTLSFAQLEQTEEYKNLASLERVELCDTIQVEFPEMAVSSKAKVCQTVYDVIKERYISVTVGEVRSSISDTVVEQGEDMVLMQEETNSNLQKGIDRATNWIVNGKGYMVAVKDEAGNWIEICSLDTPNIDEAINVWRWNNGGFGHSSHGYNGPYDMAITQEGEIVADFITTGTLTASLIQAGILQSNDGETFYLDVENGILRMKANEFQISGKTVDEIADEKATGALNNSKLYSDEILANYANTVTASLENLQEQVDGQIESYYYNYEPSLFNEPASNWTSTEERKKHEGDLFYDKSSGYAYRFYQEGSTWKWQLIQDTDITKALQTAEKAQDTADHKRRNFVVTPEPPYDIGDIWTDGTDILTATTARAEGSQFVGSDWKKLNTYTDDTVANQALEEARKSTNLTIVLDNEYQGIPTDSQGNYKGSLSASTRVQVYYGHTNITSMCTYTFAKSDGVTGDWKESTHTYTITELTEDTGWVDITADYASIFQVTKRFNVAKVKSGADGNSGSNGIGISGSTVTYQKSGDGTTPPNTWLPDIPSTDPGEYLWTRTVTTYTDENSTTTYSVSRNGLTGATGPKGDQGEQGTNFKLLITLYNVEYNATQATLNQWATPGTDAGKWPLDTTVNTTAGLKIGDYVGLQCYNGTKKGYVIILGTVKSITSESILYMTSLGMIDKGDQGPQGATGAQGPQGAPGKGITSIVNYYLATSKGSGIDENTGGWNTSPQPMSTTNKYLWNYEIVTYTDRSVTKVSPHIIGVYGDTGATGGTGAAGKGISSIIEYYALSSDTTAPADSLFKTTVPTMTATDKYLWNYETITYTDNSKKNTDKRIIGAFGDTGSQGTNFKLLITLYNVEYNATQATLNQWATPGTDAGSWGLDTTVNTTAGLKIGDYVGLQCYNGTKKGYVIILGTVKSITSESTLYMTSLGMIDKGDQGPQGATGATGAAGAKGDPGDSYTPNIANKTNQGVINWEWIMGTPGSDYTKSEVIEDGIRCCKLLRGSIENTEYSVIYYTQISPSKFQSGKTYTISFEVKSNVATYMGDNGIILSSTDAIVSLTSNIIVKQNKITPNEWCKCIYLATIKNPIPSWTSSQLPMLYIRMNGKDSPNTYYIFRNLMIVEGDREIGWTPSTEDMKGEAARTYFIEPTANILKRGANNNVTPVIITANSYYRDGNSATRTAYKGYWKVEKSTDGTGFSDLGTPWTTTYSSVPVAVGSLDRTIVAIRFTLYSDAAKTITLDMQTIPIVTDVDNLTHEQIFNLLTNNGEVKGIYQEGNQLYISFTYAKGGTLVLGGVNNERGKIELLDQYGNSSGWLNNSGLQVAGTYSIGNDIVEAQTKVSNSIRTTEKGNEVFRSGSLQYKTIASDYYKYSQEEINNSYGKPNYPSGPWYGGTNHSSLAVGSLVAVQVYNTTTKGYVYIVGSVLSVDDDGYFDMLNIGVYNTSSRGYAIATSLGLLGFGSSTAMYHYLNLGGNPSGRTERHIFYGDIYCEGTIRASGSKNRVVATDSFGEVAMNALETPEPYFTDIGSGTIGENGEISIFFDPIFSETIELTSDYQVFLTRTSAKMTEWVEKKQGYFIVHGEPGATFDWMVTCKQKGYSGVRMQEIPTSEFSSVNSDEEVNIIDESYINYPTQD